MHRPAHAWIPLVLLLAACHDEPAGPELRGPAPAASPIEAPRELDASSTVDQAPTAVSPLIASLLADAFTYLRPLPETPTTSAFDATLLHDLLVEVCVPADCGTTSLVAYRSTSADGLDTIRLDADGEHYHVNWSPGKLGLPSPAEYRIRVLAAGLELGHIDIQLLTNGAGGEQVRSDESLTILENRTLPVKFRVNRSPLIAAWLLADRGGSAGEVAATLRGSFDAQASDAAAILAYIGFSLDETTTALALAGYPVAEVAAWLFEHAPTDAAAVGALGAAGYDAMEIAGVLAAIGRSAEQAAQLLVDAGASAFDVGGALVSVFGQTIDQTATVLQASGFDAASAFDAVYRASTEVLGNPADFALRVALTAMQGAGYAFEDFRGVVIGGLQQWTQENITEALGLSGYAMSDIVPFMVDVLGLTVDRVMTRAHAWGVPLPEIVDALVGAGAQVSDIVGTAKALYDAGLLDLAQALDDAGATAEDIARAAIQVYDQTIEDVGMLLHQIGVTGEAAFNAVYDVGVEVLNNPADFALTVAFAVMKGAGYAFDDFQSAVVSRLQEWSREHVIEALGLSGFTLGEMATWMVDVLGLTYDRVAELGRSWGLPLDEIAVVLQDAQLATADIVAALGMGGFALEDIGEWLLDHSTAGADALANAARTLVEGGLPLADIAQWVWRKTGSVADTTAEILRYAGLSAGQVLDWLVHTQGVGVETAFRALQWAGYTASQAAAAAHEQGDATLAAVGEWVGQYYDASVDVTLAIMEDLGASLTELIHVAVWVFHVSMAEATVLLGEFGYAAADILALWPAS